MPGQRVHAWVHICVVANQRRASGAELAAGSLLWNVLLLLLRIYGQVQGSKAHGAEPLLLPLQKVHNKSAHGQMDVTKLQHFPHTGVSITPLLAISKTLYT